MPTLIKDPTDEFIVHEDGVYKLMLVFDSPLGNINVEVSIPEQAAKAFADKGIDIIHAR